MAIRKRTLGRRYRLIEEIGSGGMGTVYRARDTRTGDAVAVKILHPHLTRDPEYIERFRREIEITQSLASPNIIRVLDFGETGSDRFFVMEYVNGVSLHKMLRQNGALPLQQALEIATQIATALDEAHANGVVHRDIKPENIVITPDGVVKVGDFGIARAQDHTRLTLTGAVMGTVQYMAPELLTGGGDARSDIYSLGVILYHMLVGAPPFEAPTPWEILRKHREEPVPSLDALGIPAAIAPILGECLAKDPENRYQDAVSLRADLVAADDSSMGGGTGGRFRQLAGGGSGLGPPPKRRSNSPFAQANWGRTYAVVVAAFVALTVPAGAAAAFLWFGVGGGSDPVTPLPTGVDSEVGAVSTAAAQDEFRLLFYREPERQLYSIALDGTDLKQLTSEFAGGEAVSPDGKSIAYVRRLTSDDPADARTVILGTDGAEREILRLGDLRADGLNLHVSAWSPDGSTLLVAAENFPDIQLYAVPVDGDPPRKLTDGPGYKSDATWSPNGSVIAFVSDQDGEKELYTVDSTGSNLTRITFSPFDDTEPTWSPDGTRLAFTSARSGFPQVFVIDRDGRNARRVSPDGGWWGQPAWSPVANEIAMIHFAQGQGQNVFVVPADGGDSFKVSGD